MPELRKDPIVGRWVIISTDRAKRPTDFVRENIKNKGCFCPFCYGNESKTPPEIQAYRPNQNGGPAAQRDIFAVMVSLAAVCCPVDTGFS